MRRTGRRAAGRRAQAPARAPAPRCAPDACRHRRVRRRGHARVRAAARARGHGRVHRPPAEALEARADRARRELERVCAQLHEEAVLGCAARRHRPRREPRERALEGHRADHAQRHRRDRGPPLLGARRARLARHRARGAQQRPRGRHHAGRLDAHAAAREEPLPAARGQQPLDQPQDRRGLDRRAAAGQVHEGRDPHGLPQHGLLRPERLRRRGGGAHVLRQDRRSGSRCRSRRCWPGCRRRRPTTTRSSTRLPRASAATRCCRRCASLRWISADAYARGAATRRSACRRGSYGTAVSSPFVFEQVRQELDAKLPAKLAARGACRVYSTVDQRLQFAAGARSRTCSSRRAIRRPRSSRSTCTTATCSRSAPPTTSRPPTSSTWRRSGTARRARRSSCSRSSTRCAAAPTRRKVYYPSGYVSFPENDPVCPQAGGWSPHNAESGFGGYLSLETATIHSVNVVYAQLMHDLGPAQVGGDRAPARHPLEAAAALLDGARRRRRDAARADERLRDDRRGRRLPPAARDPARGERPGQDRGRQRVPACSPSASSARASPTRRRRSSSRSCTEGTGTRARLDDGRPRGRQDGHGRELRQRLVLRLHARHRLLRVGRLSRVEQAARRASRASARSSAARSRRRSGRTS